MILSPVTQSPVRSLPSQRKPAPQVIFGGQKPDRHYSSRDRIPDDVYNLLNKAPKNELHIHQGGSSSVEYLSLCLRQAIENNKAIYDQWTSKQQESKADQALPDSVRGQLLEELPVFQDTTLPKMVRFTDKNGKPLPAPQVRAATEEALTLDNLRNYYRYGASTENHKLYMDSKDIAETTAHHQPQEEMITAVDAAERERRRDEGLRTYLQTSRKINPFVKNLPAFYKLANEYAKSMAFENVRYTEYRVSPSGSGIGGATGSNIEDVLSSVYQGFEDAKQHLNQRNYKLDYGLIVLFERQNRAKTEPKDAKVKRAVQLAKDVVRLKQEGKYNICGVDLAGDEANNPVTEFKEAFDIIKEYNRTAAPDKRLGITIHAGETHSSKNCNEHYQGFESVQKAIEVAEDAKMPASKASGLTNPVRIGHGLQIINSSQALQQAFETYVQHPKDWERRIDINKIRKASPLLDKVIKDQVILEMCPKSNLQTYGIDPAFPKANGQYSVKRSDYSAAAYRRHPAVFLSRLGVKVAISSDNRTISNTDSTNEFVKLFKYSGLTYTDFKKMVMNGFDGAFISDPKLKKEVISDVQNQFKHLQRDPDSRRAIAIMDDKSSLTATVRGSRLYNKASSLLHRLSATQAE